MILPKRQMWTNLGLLPPVGLAESVGLAVAEPESWPRARLEPSSLPVDGAKRTKLTKWVTTDGIRVVSFENMSVLRTLDHRTKKSQ